MVSFLINEEKCNGCGICIAECPRYLIQTLSKGVLPSWVDAAESRCINCGHCVAICPGGAIVHEDFPQGSIMPIHEELKPSVEQMTEILRTRRSIREFTDRPVEKHLIDRIIDCARFAPSGCNSQSTEFVVVQDRAVLNEIV